MLMYVGMAVACRWGSRFIFGIATMATLAAIIMLAEAQVTANASINTDLIRGVAGFGSGACAWELWRAGIGQRARRAPTGVMGLLEIGADATRAVPELGVSECPLPTRCGCPRLL